MSRTRVNLPVPQGTGCARIQIRIRHCLTSQSLPFLTLSGPRWTLIDLSFVKTGLTFSGIIYLPFPRLEIGMIKSESINTEEVEAFREGFFPFTDADKTFGRVFNFWWSITGHMFPTFIKYARDIKIPHVRLFKKTVSWIFFAAALLKINFVKK